MDAYKCAYRSPKSPLTPLAPIDTNNYTFLTATRAQPGAYKKTPSPRTPASSRGCGCGIELKKTPIIELKKVQQYLTVSPSCTKSITPRKVAVYRQPTSPMTCPSVSPRVEQILSYSGLEKYINLFKSEEIDFDIFLELTESSLVELGIRSRTDREKILNIVHNYLNFC